MATKAPTKGIKASTRHAKSPGGEEPTVRGAGGGRPVLRVSHGSKSTALKATAPKATARARTPAATTGIKAPTLPPRASVPPRPKRVTKPAASADGAVGMIALAIAGAALDKKASNVEIIDLGGKADYADYLVLMTGGSDRHVRALSDGIQEALQDKHVRPLSVEGVSGGSWILIDFGAVVAHVFLESVRSLYDIEGLWLDAARVPVPSER